MKIIVALYAAFKKFSSKTTISLQNSHPLINIVRHNNKGIRHSLTCAILLSILDLYAIMYTSTLVIYNMNLKDVLLSIQLPFLLPSMPTCM